MNVNEMMRIVMYLDSIIAECSAWRTDDEYFLYRQSVLVRDAYLRNLSRIASESF